MSSKFNVQLFIKNNVLNAISKLPKYFRHFANYVTSVSGVKLGRFTFRFLNVQCACKIKCLSLNEQYFLVKQMYHDKIINTYMTTDTQSYLLCYSKFGSFQLRRNCIRFISSSFQNIEKLVQSALNYLL